MSVPPPLRRTLAFGLVLAGGVFLRFQGPGIGASAVSVTYGGAALWAAAWFFFIALLLRERPRDNLLYVAALVCALIEFGKLAHTPALDVFRMTSTGEWMLGRVFSPWNFLAYGAGLAGAYGLDTVLAPAPPARGKIRGKTRGMISGKTRGETRGNRRGSGRRR
jgi:hypothetical protein